MKETRLYSLFERNVGEKKWKRISQNAYKRSTAVAQFQSQLLDAALGETATRVERALRVVK